MESNHNYNGMALKDALVNWHTAVNVVLSHTDDLVTGVKPHAPTMKLQMEAVEYWREACESLSKSENEPITDVDFLESSRPDIQ